MAENKHFNWVLIAKGIGIVLVVVGHFHTKNTPAYWGDITKVIYSFHMPLFFLLSGFLYSHGKYPYPALIAGKVKRLFYPFISVAIIFLVIKYLSGLFFQLEHPVNFISFYNLLLNPIGSYMPLLWFIHALFVIFLIYPLIRTLIKNNFIILLFFIIANMVFGSNYAVFGHALANVPFFVVGVILRENHGARHLVISDTWTYVGTSLILFCSVYLLSLTIDVGYQYEYIFRVSIGIMGVVCVLNISCLIDAFNETLGKKIFTEIGIYSMTIYLFHTLFESTIRIGFKQLLGGSQVSFEVVAIVAVTAGVVFPIFLEKILLRKSALATKYILGVQ